MGYASQHINHTFSTHVWIPEAIETEGIEQFRGSIHITTESQRPHAKSVTGSYPPRREGKQGECDLDSVTKAGRISDQGCSNTHGRETSIFLPSASLKPIPIRTLFLKRICAKSYQLRIVLTLIFLTCQCKQHEINQQLLDRLAVLCTM